MDSYMLPSVVCHGQVGRSHKIRRIRCHFSEQIMEGVWKRGRQGGWYPVERGGSEETNVVRNRLVCETCSLSGAIVTFSSGLLPRAIIGSVALLQPWSVLCPWFQLPLKVVRMPRIWATICGHIGAQGLCQCRTIPMWVSWAATQGYGDVWAWAAAKAMSGSMAVPHPGSLLISKALVALEDWVGTQGLGPHLGLCCCLRAIL